MGSLMGTLSLKRKHLRSMENPLDLQYILASDTCRPHFLVLLSIQLVDLFGDRYIP